MGLDFLVSAIRGLADNLVQTTGDDLIAINSRHALALGRAQEGLRGALAKLKMNDAVELLASDLRDVLAAFGEITGKVDNERMLDHLFAAFCIGK